MFYSSIFHSLSTHYLPSSHSSSSELICLEESGFNQAFLCFVSDVKISEIFFCDELSTIVFMRNRISLLLIVNPRRQSKSSKVTSYWTTPQFFYKYLITFQKYSAVIGRSTERRENWFRIGISIFNYWPKPLQEWIATSSYSFDILQSVFKMAVCAGQRLLNKTRISQYISGTVHRTQLEHISWETLIGSYQYITNFFRQ